MKKITILILGLVLATIVLAGAVLQNVDKDVELDKETYDELVLAGMTDYTVSKIRCNNVECESVCVVKSGMINTCYKPSPSWENCTVYEENNITCNTYETIYFTNAELEEQRDNFEEEARSRVLTRYRINKAKAEQAVKNDKVAGGDHTITQK